MGKCSGYKIDSDCGAPYCPNGEEPEEDQTWEDMCEQCKSGGDRWDELTSDADRDER